MSIYTIDCYTHSYHNQSEVEDNETEKVLKVEMGNLAALLKLLRMQAEVWRSKDAVDKLDYYESKQVFAPAFSTIAQIFMTGYIELVANTSPIKVQYWSWYQ